jgi:hypothetical protein
MDGTEYFFLHRAPFASRVGAERMYFSALMRFSQLTISSLASHRRLEDRLVSDYRSDVHDLPLIF